MSIMRFLISPNPQSFAGLYGEIVRDLVQQGLMQIEGDHVRMTKRGLFLGDTVAERFILE
ncbi:Coproporphyrinogen III oxidase%2C oxygen-independent coproporphyrinogen III oxidase [Streptococcus pneumoniae]|nr:Coproporphyrinogen III oxidase%2C oxygen-independent coproporphyrinogen III oxidase [Streptococcus pneumoniae]